jgi:general stress protein YciG
MAQRNNTRSSSGKQKRGFAAMDREKQREISRKGGKSRSRRNADSER